MSAQPINGPATILCADWGKPVTKRAVYVADVAARTVRRLAGGPWSVAAVVAAAKAFTRQGSVLATFDAPIGTPSSYLAAAARVPSWKSPASFLELLQRVGPSPCYFSETWVASEWSVEQPFFAVPAGDGGLQSYVTAAGALGVELRRAIEVATRANPLFVKSGIPGSVGSGTCVLWQEMAALLARPRDFRVWPFEGSLEPMVQTNAVVVGEIYPRAAYATALLDGSSESRPRLSLSKTDPEVRSSAIQVLRTMGWVGVHGVSIQDLAEAEGNEDDFDACVTACALLRCVLERLPLYQPDMVCPTAEGGMLGTGAVNFRLAERAFGLGRKQAVAHSKTRPATLGKQSVRDLRCPIPGCPHVFRNSRGGWDAHAASTRSHLSWHPEVQSAERRKEMFRAEFPSFFE